jgi:hypothetical protein
MVIGTVFDRASKACYSHSAELFALGHLFLLSPEFRFDADFQSPYRAPDKARMFPVGQTLRFMAVLLRHSISPLTVNGKTLIPIRV